MRIQHNIMAMNAYRNLSNNQSALSKNLEKLSSGYKINRAGDDAAGLAISEKMRAQITGLDAAQKNVKDGISLVKTAEGALQEVHDMLGRMKYLATQSANGTYDNDVDRANLQKEVNSLLEEIDRIADSANFNGQKLLNGSLAGANVIDGSFGKPTEMAGVNVGTVHKDGVNAQQDPSFSIDLSNLSITKATVAGDKVEFTIGGAKVQIDVDTTKDMTASDIATKLAAAINGTDSGIAADGKTENLKGIKITVQDASGNNVSLAFMATADGSKINFTLANTTVGGASGSNKALEANISAGLNVSVATAGGAFSHGAVLNGKDALNGGTQALVHGIAKSTAALATLDFKLTGDILNNGSVLTIGSNSYAFNINGKASGIKFEDDVTVINISAEELKKHGIQLDDDGNIVASTANESKAIHLISEKLVNEGNKNNSTFQFGLASDDTIHLVEKTGASADMQKQLSVESLAEKLVKLTDFVPGKTEKKGDPLNLQIGDTSDKYNQMQVAVDDMHAAALGIGGLKIDTQQDAHDAVDKIMKAINSVSSTRGDLGAIQNRLEHTHNNLGVMKENIQDAESTIRDTDVADEMMKYTKNNILVQASQAMLAQANQVPQGVLQLLQ